MTHDDKEANAAETAKVFYDTFGWKMDDESGVLFHHSYFQDLDETATNYRYDHEMRHRGVYQPSGEFFLDAGCGGEPRHGMSEGFRMHVCVDVSKLGLQEARKQLEDSGAYVLADLAALPFKEKSFDGVLASHCLYHVEKDLQKTVLGELYRVTKPERNILVFYSSRYNLISLAHKAATLVFPPLNVLLHRVGIHATTLPPYIMRLVSGKVPSMEVPDLYSYAHNPVRLAKEFPLVDVTCLMTLSIYDTKMLRMLHLLNVVIPLLDRLEKAFPHFMRYVGKFTCIRIQKGLPERNQGGRGP